MLATRNLRLAAIKHVQPYRCVWSSSGKTLPMLQPTATKWITGSSLSSAYYSKDNKKEVPFSSICKFVSCNKNKRYFTTSSVNLTSNPASNPNIPLQETTLNSTNPQLTSVLPSDNLSASSTPPTSTPKPTPPSTSKTPDDSKTKDTGCSAGSLGEAGVRLPKKEEVEHFLIKLLVYLWDFSYYVFCVSRKLFETYVVNNSKVQHNWKQLIKRMDAARKEIKTK